jgi:GNAT superfamily N-acetyltransferase
MIRLEYLPVTLADIEGLVNFLVDVFETTSVEFWRNWFSLIWDENPAFCENHPRGFLAKHDDKIVGFIAWFPVMLQFRGEEIVSSNGGGLAVHHDFRRRGIATALRKRHLETSADTFVFATTPGNPITLRINQKCGFKLLPNNVHHRYYFYSIFIIDPKEWLKVRYISHLSKALPFCSKIMCFLLDRYQSIRLRTFRKRLSQGRDLMVREVREADVSFDALWKETKHYYTITNVRSSEVINWYLNPKNKERKRLYACYRNKKLLAYMIFTEREIRGIKALFCADVWYKRCEGWALERILDYAIDRAAKMACGAVVLRNYTKELSSYFGMLGLARIRDEKRNEFYRAPEWMERLIDRDNSYFVYIQGDRGM